MLRDLRRDCITEICGQVLWELCAGNVDEAPYLIAAYGVEQDRGGLGQNDMAVVGHR